MKSGSLILDDDWFREHMELIMCLSEFWDIFELFRKV